MRRTLALTLTFLAAGAAPAAAQSTGGALYAPAPRGFSVTPASVAPGAPVTFAFRAAAPGAHVRARVDLLAAGPPAGAAARPLAPAPRAPGPRPAGPLARRRAGGPLHGAARARRRRPGQRVRPRAA